MGREVTSTPAELGRAGRGRGQQTALVSGWLCLCLCLCPACHPEGMGRATWGAGLATHGCVSRAHLVSPARVSASSSTESSAGSTKLPLCPGDRKAQGCGLWGQRGDTAGLGATTASCLRAAEC